MLKDIVDGVKTQISKNVLNRDNITEVALAAFFAGGQVLITGSTGLGKNEWAKSLTKSLDIEPFITVATQEESDTLPDATKDRFMIKLHMSYPGIAAEKQLLQMYHNGTFVGPKLLPVCNQEAILQAKEEVQAVAVDDPIFNYIISIIETTRRMGAVITGASPRGGIALLQSSKAWAAVKGRDYVMQHDVTTMALPVLRHRLKLKPDAIAEGIQPDHIIESILS